MKRVLINILIVTLFMPVLAQEGKDFPPYPIPESYTTKAGQNLPYKWDNSQFDFFPEVFNQAGWSCNQASSIGYVLTYELNRLRGLKSDDWPRLYSPGFVYSFLNGGSYGTGVSYFDSWEIVKKAGCPTYVVYPYYNQPGVWMSGYDRYYAAMKNRIVANYSMPVGTPEDLEVFKQFLLDRFEGASSGGIGSFQIASGGMEFTHWMDPETGTTWPVLKHYGTVVGHAMTFVGWNDSVRLDVNNDGMFTNDIDINDDGVVNMKDWEIGAMLVVNSWGKGWGLGGKAYVPYRLLAYEGHEGGIWNRSTHVIKPVKDYRPQLTMRVVMEHQSKEKFRLMAGVSADPKAKEPEHYITFPHFNFLGGDIPLRDPENHIDTTRFELGLDVTPLLSFTESGKEARFFLIVEENDPMNTADGKIREFSVISYDENEQADETISREKNVAIINDDWTSLSVNHTFEFNKLSIKKEGVLPAHVGDDFGFQLIASGGEPPYSWSLVKDYKEQSFTRMITYPEGDVLLKNGQPGQFARIDLPFLFTYFGKQYDHLFVDRNGALHFENEFYQYPYVVDWNLVFKVRKSIVPFGTNLSLTDPSDKVIYSASDSVATVYWDVSYEENSINYDIQFEVNLYPDGAIEFHYGAQNHPDSPDFYWMAGISNGDGMLYKYSTASEMGIVFPNYGVKYTPMDYPPGLELSDGGLLTGRADKAGAIWNVLVQVRDRKHQTISGVVPISTIDWDSTRILHQNYPNPFNRTTVISFLSPVEDRAVLDIIDSSGRRVKTLLDKVILAGDYTILWNARNEENRDVDPGIYYYRLVIGDKKVVGKMMVIK